MIYRVPYGFKRTGEAKGAGLRAGAGVVRPAGGGEGKEDTQVH